MLSRGGSRGLAVLRRLRPFPLAVAAATLAFLAVAAFAALHSHLVSPEPPSGLDAPPTPASLALAASLAAASSNGGVQGILDSDHDGLSDALENYVYGTDSQKASSSGSGIPDGWLAAYGFDPRDPTIGNHPAASPPGPAIPTSYHGVWPDRFVATLYQVYTYSRPATWNESAQGPFVNSIDPTQWDSNGDGIPDGYLLAFHLDPRAGNVSSQQLAGPAGLTVREAFEHGTDPTKLDSDGDGIPDREEIDGPSNPAGGRFPPTDPARYDTSGSGVCDGYLRAYGLDPTKPALAYADLAHSGNTTREKFLWSRQRFGGDACTSGKGLNPTKASTLDLKIPDGWLLRYGLDPLDKDIPDKVVQDSAALVPPCTPPADLPVLPEVKLTVFDKYAYGRPPDWQESKSGPWTGGLNPTKDDGDGDGIPDALELKGYFVRSSTQLGPRVLGADGTPLLPPPQRAQSDPTKADSDGDGLTDGQEICPSLRTGAVAQKMPPTNATRRDTDFDGLDDRKEIELDGTALAGTDGGLDPTRADTPGDYLRDGERYDTLQSRSQHYLKNNLVYDEYPNGHDTVRKVDWLANPRWSDLIPGAKAKGITSASSAADVAALLGPLGSLDNKVANILNSDIDGDGLKNGLEVHPEQYAFTAFKPTVGGKNRPATDPLNPDTDGDDLKDGWEVKYGIPNAEGTDYNLNPIRWDSGSGSCTDGTSACSDADKDFKHNSFDWYTYAGNPLVRQTTLIKFSNRDKHDNERFGLNPNKFSTSGDDLGDGWKVFWGLKYPTLSGASLGTVYPGGPTGPNTASADLIHPMQDESQAILATYRYTRFVSNSANTLPWEIAVAGYQFPSASPTVFKVAGALPITLKMAKDYGLNPYMVASSASSDGDTLSDGWEILGRLLKDNGFPGQPPTGCAGSADGPDPADPDAGSTAPVKAGTTDQITYLQKFTAGSGGGADTPYAYPLCYDSDLGGVGDAAERVASKNPLEPADDTSGDQDSDHDGIPNPVEIAAGTDPFSPDSDGDGLLDGTDLPPGGSDFLDPLANATAREFLDLGIAYKTTVTSGKTLYHFYGEQTVGTSATNPFDAGGSVPTGWLKAYDRLGSSQASTYAPYYTLGKPTWWREAVDGPWWGGASPAISASDLHTLQQNPDLDCDGLTDARGDGSLFEDPFPAANKGNQWHAIPPSDYAQVNSPGSANYVLPPGAAPPPALPAMVQRLMAQAFLSPSHSEGFSPKTADQCANSSSGTPPTPALTVLTPTDRAVLVKGSKTQVTGHVAASNPAGMTVEAVMGDQVFGAGFTDGNGDFSFPLNITAAQSVNMAQPLPGAVLRGQTEGWVNWTANPSRVPPSTGIGLTIRTYATANTPPFTTPPRSLPALASASRSLSMVVHATSLLSLSTASKQVLAEQPFRIDFRLTDSGGSPLPEDTLAFAGATPQSVQGPDATGVGQAVFVLHANQGSTVNITVTSRPSQRELTSNLVTGASKPLTFTIRQAATLKLDSLAATADAGTILPVTGTLTTASGPVAGANITVTLTKGGALFGSFPATTAEGTGGRFEADIPLSSNLPFGAYLVAASSAATPTAAAAPGDSKPIQVNGLPFFKDLSSDTLAAEGPAYVTGVLVESSDPTVPLPSAKVTVRLGDAVPVTRTTAADGSFNATIPGPFAHHPIVQSAIFAGDDRHAAVTTPVERPVLSSTRLILPDGILPRGAPTAVPVRLTGASGDPVAGASMDVKWGTEPSVHLLTDDSGTAVLGRPGSPNEPLGSVRVQAWFNGSADGFWAPRSGGAVWSVQTLARLNLPTGAFDAGSFIPSGLLQDAGTQAPIGHATVLLRLDAGNVTPLQTDELGHFTFLASNARDAAPSTVRIQADFPGSGVYPPAHARSTVTIRSPVTLTPQPPPAIVAGQPTPLLVLVQDARGVRISEGQVNATLDGLLIGSAPVRDGVATLVATVPASHAAGDVGLSIDYSGSPTEGAAHTQALVHLLLPVHLEVQASGVKPGTTATVRVTLTDGGRPLPFAPVLLDVEGLGGLQGTTDKDGVATFLVLQGNTTMHMAARYGGAGSLAPATATASLVPVVPETLLHAGLRIGTWVFIAAAALLVAAAVTAYFLRRHPLEPALKRARRAILGRGPYATQILLAYRVLEDSAIASEILTGPATTPRTLEAAIAPTLPPALHGSLDRLITLFEQARYGKLPIGEAERDAAVAALDDLLRQLSRMDPFWHPSSKRRPAGGAA